MKQARKKIRFEQLKKAAISIFLAAAVLGNIVQYYAGSAVSRVPVLSQDAGEAAQENRPGLETESAQAGQEEGSGAEEAGDPSQTEATAGGEAFEEGANGEPERFDEAAQGSTPNGPDDPAEAGGGSTPGGANTSVYIDGKLNINAATQADFETLKGIGPSKAKAIIDYRNAYGGFQCIEEITEVKGIGEGIFKKIKDSICTP